MKRQTHRNKKNANREDNSADEADDIDLHRIRCHLDQLLEDRGMTLTDLADQVGVTKVNLSVLKNNRARAIRFSTLTGICDALGCDVGDLLSLER